MSPMTLPIPVIETERLILRGHRISDLDAIATFNESPRSHWIGGPKNRHESWRVLIGMIGHWSLRGYGIWMVEHKATQTPCGGVGILHHEGWDEPELGWHVYDGFEGQGLAQEAVVAARAYAAKHFAITAPISHIDPENARSVQLAERLGARFEREGMLLGHPCHIYRHPKIAEAA